MKLFFDKQTNVLSTTLGGRAIASLPLPLGLHDVVLTTLDGGRPWSIPTNERVIQLGLANEAGEILALCEDWTQNSATKQWHGVLSLATEEMVAAIEAGAVVSTQLVVSHDGLTPYRSQTIATTVSAPAFVDPGDLTSLPGSDAIYFNYTIAQTLTGPQQAQKRTDLGLGTAATANSSDLLARANHTGTQSADTLTDGTTNKAFTATERTKLAGIATGATANDTDANLKNRTNHTGTQLLATISDAGTAASRNVGTADGNVPVVQADGKLLSSLIPTMNIVDVQVVANEAARLALTAEAASNLLVVDADTGKSWMLVSGGDPSISGDWVQIGDRALTMDEVSGLVSALANKAETATTISGGGLVTGGGDLSTNRTLTVTEASEADMTTGTDGTKAVTARRVASWWTSIKAAAASISGAWSFADITVDAEKASAARVVGVTASGNFANSDNGKLVNVTGTALVTRTVPSGLSAGWRTEIVNSTTGLGSAMIAASGVTLNGGTTSIRVERGSKAVIEYLASNAYAVKIMPQGSPRIELANMFPNLIAWGTPSTSGSASGSTFGHSFSLTVDAAATAGAYAKVTNAVPLPIIREGAGQNLRLAGSRIAVLLDAYTNGLSAQEVRLLLGVASGTNELINTTAGLGLVITGATTAKLQISDGTTLNEKSITLVGFDSNQQSRYLLTWDGETNTLFLYEERHDASTRPSRFAFIDSLTATPSTFGSGVAFNTINWATNTAGYNRVVGARGISWFNDIITH